jgi:hypothetical protein
MTETTTPSLAEMQAVHVRLCQAAVDHYDTAMAIGYGNPGYDSAIRKAQTARSTAVAVGRDILRAYGPKAG